MPTLGAKVYKQYSTYFGPFGAAGQGGRAYSRGFCEDLLGPTSHDGASSTSRMLLARLRKSP